MDFWHVAELNFFLLCGYWALLFGEHSYVIVSLWFGWEKQKIYFLDPGLVGLGQIAFNVSKPHGNYQTSIVFVMPLGGLDFYCSYSYFTYRYAHIYNILISYFINKESRVEEKRSFLRSDDCETGLGAEPHRDLTPASDIS